MKVKEKFTPGPWQAFRPSQNDSYVVLSYAVHMPEELGFRVCCDIRGRKTSECEANAHLIAAAPEMYEALCDMVSDHESLSEATIEYAKRVLAKARGEREEI